jgi:putative drug exporter of the RND superfamily
MNVQLQEPVDRGPVARLARWAVAHRRLVGLAWVGLFVGLLALSGAVGSKYSTNFSLPGSDSQHAYDVLARDFPKQSGDSDQIVLRARGGALADAAVRARVQPMLAAVAKLPHVTGVASPYAAGGAAAISKDGRIGFATVAFDERANVLPTAAVQRVVDVARSAATPALQVELGGQAIQQLQKPKFGAATMIGLLAAILVLLITFGSLIAMGMPMLTAFLGLGTAFGLIGLMTRVLATPDFSSELAAMIGLGVGIDYALFIVTRFRENFRNGMDVDDAVVAAMDTAGRAVAFAGMTVIIAVLGMCLLGVSFLYGMSAAIAIGVAMTMLAALTLLPVLLSRFGARVGRLGRRARRTASAAAPPRPTRWMQWAELVSRHPWPAMLAGLAIVLVLAVPALSLRMGTSDSGNDPTSLTTRRAYDLLAEGFGKGFNGPLLVVAKLPAAGAGERAALVRIERALRATPGIASVTRPALSPRGATATIQAFPRSAPQDAATTDLVNELRDRRLPPVAKATGAQILVGGSTAVGVDFANILSGKLPLFIGAVIGLAALLLLVVFRSLVIPLQAAVMNLLSIGASLGVSVAVFQWGWLGGPLGVQGGPIDAFIPVMLFAIVFGLSMDYEVFLVSRIHEEWTRRRDPSRAVVVGLGATGRVITAAATIMICVFLSFAFGDERVVKLFGLSFAIAVFIDAFVVRSLLLPAVLQLLGRRTWWLPQWLDRRLPHLAIDPAEQESDAAQVAEPALEGVRA